MFAVNCARLIVVESVEFSFNDIMHRQIDGVAMGSPLTPALANYFRWLLQI